MSTDELTARLVAHEDNFVERKSEGINPSDFRKALTAFSNSLPPGRAAALFIGVNDRTGVVEGCQNPDKVQQRVREAGEQCYPPITSMSEVINVGGKHIVAVTIEPSENRPHFSGPAFVRVGSSSVKASREMFDELVNSRNGKVAAILDLRGETISVLGLGHRFGAGPSRRSQGIPGRRRVSRSGM
jgi:predicted HTH transcriptional regulator